MAKKTLRAPDPRSEAAIHRLIRGWNPDEWDVQFSGVDGARRLEIFHGITEKTLAVIDLRALVRKRKEMKTNIIERFGS